MGIYTTQIIIRVILFSDDYKEELKKTTFERTMELPFNPYLVEGKSLELNANGKSLAVEVANVKWSEIRARLPKIKLAIPALPEYEMLVERKECDMYGFSTTINHLKSDLNYGEYEGNNIA